MTRLLEVLGMAAAFPNNAANWSAAQEVTISYCTAMRRFRSVLRLENTVISKEARVLLDTKVLVKADPDGLEEKHTLLAFLDQNGDTSWEAILPGHKASRTLYHVRLSPMH